jgi:hypothetical protein
MGMEHGEVIANLKRHKAWGKARKGLEGRGQKRVELRIADFGLRNEVRRTQNAERREKKHEA